MARGLILTSLAREKFPGIVVCISAVDDRKVFRGCRVAVRANRVGRRGLHWPGVEFPGVVAEKGPVAFLGVLEAENDGAAVHEPAVDRVLLFGAARLVLERGAVGRKSGCASGGRVSIN